MGVGMTVSPALIILRQRFELCAHRPLYVLACTIYHPSCAGPSDGFTNAGWGFHDFAVCLFPDSSMIPARVLLA